MAGIFTWKNILDAFAIFLLVLLGLGGFALFIYGTIFSIFYQRFDQILNNDNFFHFFGILLAFFGVIIVSMAGVSCVVVLKKNLYRLAACWLYSLWVLSVILLILLVTSIVLGAKDEEFKEDMIEALDDALYREYHIDKGSQPIAIFDPLPLNNSQLFNSLHQDLQCCGSEGIADFKQTKKLPWSCCTHAAAAKCLPTHAFLSGCAGKLGEVVIGVVVTQIIVMAGLWMVTTSAAILTTVIICNRFRSPAE